MEDFFIEKKIYYHDTDCGGVVYYGNYLKHLEESRSEYCYSKGVNLKELVSQGVYFVVAHVEIDYKAPARYQDTLKVTTRVDRIGNSSVYFSQKILKGSILILDSKTTWVCVGRDFKPAAVPPDIRQALLP
ncbi:MAG TPA: thioesterase family protein [Patescibacteria group bacterium]|nr:thioesterase family protein [Patescibacteria group bacterium]